MDLRNLVLIFLRASGPATFATRSEAIGRTQFTPRVLIPDRHLSGVVDRPRGALSSALSALSNPYSPTTVPPGTAGSNAQLSSRVSRRPVSGCSRCAQSVTMIATAYVKLMTATHGNDHS